MSPRFLLTVLVILGTLIFSWFSVLHLVSQTYN